MVADLYHFSIQANMVCGKGGLIRFGFLPKHVATGGNFGLTNFLMVLLRSFDCGRLGPKVKTVYRHTDGGSDNVSIVTHIMHWLLVYLGVADEIISVSSVNPRVSGHDDFVKVRRAVASFWSVDGTQGGL